MNGLQTLPNLNKKSRMIIRLFRIFLLLLYFALLLAVTFLGREQELKRMAWLSLFGSFRRAWDERHAFIFWGIVANFMMMLPLGILLGWGRSGLSFWKVTLFAAFLSFVIECMQYVTRLGYFDVDDICTNVWGAAAGGGFCRSINELTEGIRKDRKPKWLRIIAQLLPFTLFLVFFGYFLTRIRF